MTAAAAPLQTAAVTRTRSSVSPKTTPHA